MADVSTADYNAWLEREAAEAGLVDKPKGQTNYLRTLAAMIPQVEADDTTTASSIYSRLGRTATALPRAGLNTMANWLESGGRAWKGESAAPVDTMPGQGYSMGVSGLGPDDTIAPLGLAGMGMAMVPRGAAVGVFGGRLAQTADHAALAKAEEMAAAGASRDDIWRDTGWFQGPDQKWRFEIPDERSYFKETDKTVGRLPDYLGHRDFFNAYPNAKDAQVITEVRPQGAFSGSWDDASPGGGALASIGPRGDPDVARYVALHEIQHGIQDAEGFAKGSSASRPLVQDVRERAIDDYMRVFRPSEEAKGVPWKDTWEAANRFVDSPEGRQLIYQKHAGEVEARNVQARRDMTPDERRATPPWKTQDVPDEQQIVRYGSGVQESTGGRGLSKPLPAAAESRRFHDTLRTQGLKTPGGSTLSWNPQQLWYDIIRDGQPVGRTFVTTADMAGDMAPGTFILGPKVEEGFRRKGIATDVYDALEDFGRRHGLQLAPGKMQSAESREMWRKRAAKSTRQQAKARDSAEPSMQIAKSAEDVEILKKYGWVPIGMAGGGMMMAPPAEASETAEQFKARLESELQGLAQ